MLQDLIHIQPDQFSIRPCPAWAKDWFLLCVGDLRGGRSNLMTVGWGFFGTMWAKPVAIAAVRPQRWSMPLLEEFDTFTLCALPESLKEKALWCGRHSGAEGDKFAGAGLTAAEAFKVDAPIVAESELIVECRKLYLEQLHAKCFADKSIAPEVYPDDDFHWMAYGEILSIRGTKKYC